MKVKNSFLYLIILALVATILVLRSCSPTPPPPEPIITTTIDTLWLEQKYDTIYIPSETKYIPADPKIQYIDVDTTAILKDYFAHRLYEDTIKIDTLGFVIIKDDISQNRIVERHTFLDYKIPTIKETTIIDRPYKPKNQLYIGFDIMGNKIEPVNYFGPSLTFKNKKDHLYDVGVGLGPNNIVNYKFGTKWIIRIK